MSEDKFEEIRAECACALAWSGLCSSPDMSPLLDDVFELVTAAIRRRFGTGIVETEMILRDARNAAEVSFDEYGLDHLVDPDEAVEAIAKHLAELEEEGAEQVVTEAR